MSRWDALVLVRKRQHHMRTVHCGLSQQRRRASMHGVPVRPCGVDKWDGTDGSSLLRAVSRGDLQRAWRKGFERLHAAVPTGVH